MDELYELYLKYRGKNIDDDFLNKAFDLTMRKEKCLLPYIADFKITENTKDKRFGTYSHNSRLLTVNKGKINDFPVEQKNIFGIQILRHELEHARNIRTLEEQRQDIESRIIQYSLKVYSLLSGKEDLSKTDNIDLLLLIANKSLNYDIDPEERLADIKAWRYMVNFLKNQRNSKDILLARTYLYYAYIRGYKDNRYYLDCPTYMYLLNTHQLEDLKRLKNTVDTKDYSLGTRLIYGLPITYEEHKEGVLDKVLLQRRKNEKAD